MLMNCENRKSLPGYYARDKNGQPIELIWAGKYYNITKPDSFDQAFYQMLAKHCGLIFLTDETPKALSVYPVPMFVIFATDLDGNYYGSIGGFGDILYDEFPIGFVNREGRYGKLVCSMKAFLELTVFYPRWRECLRERLTDDALDQLLIEITSEELPNYPLDFAGIIKQLGFTRKPELLEYLFSSLRRDAGFTLYESIEEAEKDCEFLMVE